MLVQRNSGLYDKNDDVDNRFRNAVLDALDTAAKDSGWGYCGWHDEDLPELFKAIDAQRARAEKRARDLGGNADDVVRSDAK